MGIASVIICLVASGATIAYRINYDGQVIATVNSKKLFSDAVSLAVNEVGDCIKSEISKPAFSTVLTLKNELSSKTELKDAILENTETVVYASLLKVNGESVAYVSDTNLEQYINKYRNSFNVKGDKSVSAFTDTVEVQTGYFNTDTVLSLEEAKEIISQLEVTTTAVVTSKKDIPYSTTVKKTSTKMLGYSSVITAGKKGAKSITDQIVYVNGKEVSRKNLSTKVLSEPVNQVTVVGTAKSLASPSQRNEAYSSGFIFPLPKGSGWKVSAYWGDGRNHKAIDLCVSYGTNIYAVAAGTVTYAGYKSDYGYLVVIDHGNGLSTAYAHASTLGVSTGDRVSAGETIALVGSTGYSTGNHLHFEVRKNGTRIDPAPYIGLD